MGCGTVIVAAVIFSIFQGIGMPWWGCLAVAVVAAAIFERDNRVSHTKPDLEAIMEVARKEARRELDAERASLDLWARTLQVQARFMDRAAPPPKADAGQLPVGSLRVIRNNLMKHHEGKRSDASYQASASCKETTDILQSLNRLIDQKKAKA